MFDNKKKYRNVYCVNCGLRGHIVKDCTASITSFGFIAFKQVNNEEEEKGDLSNSLKEILQSVSSVSENCYSHLFPKTKFLMIQRKDTMGYIDFIRGKYSNTDKSVQDKLLKTWLDEMIEDEKKNLLRKSFDELWDELWVNKNSKTYKNEYYNAKVKYELLDVKSLVSESSTKYNFQEFGFPKGRRNMREKNLECAKREFYEETGYDESHYTLIDNYPEIVEEFVGTNGISYKHVYYLVQMKDNSPPPKVDTSNILQIGEVQNVGWFTFNECMSIIRPYDVAKQRVLTKVYEDIKNNRYIDSKLNFYNSSYYLKYRYNNSFKRHSTLSSSI